MTIILNSEVLSELTRSGNLRVIRKVQKVHGNCNYYFTPTIGINLYNPRVKFVDKKFIVFVFDKYKNSGLFSLLKHIDSVLQNLVKKSNSEVYDKEMYSLFSEDETEFVIRCYLPNKMGKYLIHTDCDNFHLPRSGAMYEMVTVEFRNIWKTGVRIGFNTELKFAKIGD